MTDDQMDAVFAALASAARRRILDIIKHAPGSNVNQIAAHFDVSRIQVMKHLRALEEADLVISKKVGRERLLYMNAVPIQLIHDRWTTEFSALWAGNLTALKFAIETDPAIVAMNRELEAPPGKPPGGTERTPPAPPRSSRSAGKRAKPAKSKKQRPAAETAPKPNNKTSNTKSTTRTRRTNSTQRES